MPDVRALYEGAWRVGTSQIVSVGGVCEGSATYRVTGVTSECPSSVTVGRQTNADLEGGFLIRVSPHVIGLYDDVWGPLTGNVDTTGNVTIDVRVAGGSATGFEDLTGCTNVTGDNAFSGRVSSDSLRLSATFTGNCINLVDSNQVSTQWTMEFTGVASPLDLESANIRVSPGAVTLQSGTSTQFSVEVEDASGFVLTEPLVAWSSADPAIAAVTPDGIVSVVEVGSTEITAAVAWRSGSASVAVSGFTFTSVSAGGSHSCGVTTDGVACWGGNRWGQLGFGSDDLFRLTPVAVSGGLALSTVGVGGGHSCGLTAGGIAYCWGNNWSGQLGDGSTTDRSTPAAVSGGLEFVAVSAGVLYTCALTNDGTAYCWGENGGGQIGDGSTTDRTTPTAVSGGLELSTVSVGGGHSCGITTGGTAYCWGHNWSGQLGDGSTAGRTTPTAVSGGLELSTVSVGGGHSCGITAGGIAYCWGDNWSGQLGDGSTSDRSTPTAVSGGLEFAAVSAGGSHSCGLTAGGIAYCWGNNEEGQLGVGSTANRSAPVRVHGGITFTSVRASAGESLTCGLSSAGIAFCWGHGLGTGDGTGYLSTVPVRVAGQP
jgi:alpha-tubulin suppressor-like RCC1 family protein